MSEPENLGNQEPREMQDIEYVTSLRTHSRTRRVPYHLFIVNQRQVQTASQVKGVIEKVCQISFPCPKFSRYFPFLFFAVTEDCQKNKTKVLALVSLCKPSVPGSARCAECSGSPRVHYPAEPGHRAEDPGRKRALGPDDGDQDGGCAVRKGSTRGEHGEHG